MADPFSGKELSIEDAQMIFEAFAQRQKNLPEEDLFVSLTMVLLNIGERFRSVTCTEGEWIGKKKDVVVPEEGSIPTCPNGHPLFQAEHTITLGWVMSGMSEGRDNGDEEGPTEEESSEG